MYNTPTHLLSGIFVAAAGFLISIRYIGTAHMNPPPTLIFQSAKLGNLSWILKELDWAEKLLNEGVAPGRIFGVSGGNLQQPALLCPSID